MWESIKILDIMAPNSTSAHMRDTIFQGHPPNTGPKALKTDPKTENYQVANQKYSNDQKIRLLMEFDIKSVSWSSRARGPKS